MMLNIQIWHHSIKQCILDKINAVLVSISGEHSRRPNIPVH